jgi:hypothetical protein
LQAPALPLGHVAVIGVVHASSRLLKEQRPERVSPIRNACPTLGDAMERKTGLEPATPTLARLCSTTEPLPHRAKGSLPTRPSRCKCGEPHVAGQDSGPGFGGSAARITCYNMLRCFGGSWALSSGGEHFLDAEGVRGSNPLAPTSNTRRSGMIPVPDLLAFMGTSIHPSVRQSPSATAPNHPILDTFRARTAQCCVRWFVSPARYNCCRLSAAFFFGFSLRGGPHAESPRMQHTATVGREQQSAGTPPVGKTSASTVLYCSVTRFAAGAGDVAHERSHGEGRL